jgi:hypothetical protein
VGAVVTCVSDLSRLLTEARSWSEMSMSLEQTSAKTGGSSSYLCE